MLLGSIQNLHNQIIRKTKTNNGETLSGSTVVPHLATNKDWGAVSYLSNSVYGTAKNIIAKEINEKGNIKYIFGKLFPSKSYIYQYMPIAHKHHILLPVAWIYRLFVKVTDEEESIKVKLEYKYLTKKSF